MGRLPSSSTLSQRLSHWTAPAASAQKPQAVIDLAANVPFYLSLYLDLRLLRVLKLTQYGPEQVDFLRYRPVLDNRRLKEDFGYIPAKTSREAFDVFVEARNG